MAAIWSVEAKAVRNRGALPRLRGRGEQGLSCVMSATRAALYSFFIETQASFGDVLIYGLGSKYVALPDSRRA